MKPKWIITKIDGEGEQNWSKREWMEALKANPEEVELLISTESIEKADAIIAPKDISRGVKKRSNHYATKAQFSHLIEGCRYKRSCILAEKILKGIPPKSVKLFLSLLSALLI